MSSKIEWCDETLNPQGWGCYGPGGTPEKPRPCAYCYAHRQAGRWLRDCDLCRQFIPHWHPEQLDKPHRWTKPRKIFWQSMGDLFHPCSPEFQISLVLSQAQSTPRHTHIFLTKNPKRLSEFNPWPSNCWVGTTVTNQAGADERIPWLLKVDAAVRFVSHEPLLGAVKLEKYWLETPKAYKILSRYYDSFGFDATGSQPEREKARIDWAIIGAMTGAGAVMPTLFWIKDLIAQYQAAGVPLFLKDNLGWSEKIQAWPLTPRQKP